MYNNLTYGDLVTKLGHQARADLLELGTVASSSTEKNMTSDIVCTQLELHKCILYLNSSTLRKEMRVYK